MLLKSVRTGSACVWAARWHRRSRRACRELSRNITKNYRLLVVGTNSTRTFRHFRNPPRRQEHTFIRCGAFKVDNTSVNRTQWPIQHLYPKWLRTQLTHPRNEIQIFDRSVKQVRSRNSWIKSTIFTVYTATFSLKNRHMLDWYSFQIDSFERLSGASWCLWLSYLQT